MTRNATIFTKKEHYINALITILNSIHIIIPHTVGNKIAPNVHFHDEVSFFIVKQVVEHGQCIKENIITDIAVAQVQPFSTSKFFKTDRLLISIKFPVAI